MSVHDGHRKRLIEKLSTGTLLEHEMLEALLFNAVPRRNTNDIAHRLLAAFGTIENMFDAPMSALKAVDGVGDSVASYLFCIGVFYKKFMETSKMRAMPRKWVQADFKKFAELEYKGLDREVLDVYLLNAKCEIFFKKRFSDDNAASVRVNPAEFSNLFSQCGVEGLVMVHNHPNGEAKPSPQDDDGTDRCLEVCRFHNVPLCDHIIYAPNGVYSYYYSGRLKELELANEAKKEKIKETFWESGVNENE